MEWSLYQIQEQEEDKFLPPLKFSNNKTQEDVVNEVIKAIKEGYKIIFIRGICGTGKSAIALNLAKELGKSSIVVPVKTLQKQYEDDYTNKKYLLKNNKEKLKINIITGRANFPCSYLQETPPKLDLKEAKEEIKEKDSTLDIFDFPKNKKYPKNQKLEPEQNNENSCNNHLLPCKIEIKEKNFQKLKEYLKQNPKIKVPSFVSIGHIRRLSIAPICPYWSPIVPSEIDLSVLENSTKKTYIGLKDKQYTFYQRKPGCGYYDQYKAYLDSDVIIFNSHKYKLETAMNRKPATELEIIDECDEFLDSFSNQKKINLNRLNLALGGLFSDNEKTQERLNKLAQITLELVKDSQLREYAKKEEILAIKNTKIYHLLQEFIENNFMNHVECDEENYCYHVEEVARTFQDFFDETYLSFHQEERGIVARIVTTNLEKRFKELTEKNKVFVMMSGTLHSERVLKDIFGISEFKVIEAETKTPGKISELRTGLELNCKYENFRKGIASRRQYLLALSKCISDSKKPTLVHVNSFFDLPSEQELKEYNLNIMTQENLRELQSLDKMGDAIKRFKRGEIKILYSTKCNRGVDFPGEICNSIILTKYPYPNISSLFWKILRKTKPQHYHEFYIDKSKREFLQKIYRGLRSEQDHIFLLSPDIRIFNQI